MLRVVNSRRWSCSTDVKLPAWHASATSDARLGVFTASILVATIRRKELRSLEWKSCTRMQPEAHLDTAALALSRDEVTSGVKSLSLGVGSGCMRASAMEASDSSPSVLVHAFAQLVTDA